MGYARSEIVESSKVGTYHCVARCVRRAFLCGKDEFSGKSFEHRREWIRRRLSQLTEIFAVEVIAYAVMSNHLHSLLRIRPDSAKEWDAEEVALRWRTLFPLRYENGKPCKPNEQEIQAIAGQRDKVKLYRERLCSVSWFNRCLNEHIARRANTEDDCTGRFWEGRFKCQRVYDVAGIIACAAYIDLNPVRAGAAKTLEASDHTSVQDRIHERQKSTPHRCRAWTRVPLISIPDATGKRLTVDEYLTLVDETGRLILQGKGAISDAVAPILSRLNIKADRWVETTQHFKLSFRRVVGPEEVLIAAAARAKKCWFHGLAGARRLFGATPAQAAPK